MKRRTSALAGLAIAAGVIAGTAGIASAHDTTASATCRAGLVWNAHNYNPAQTNSIIVTVDGEIVHKSGSFGASDAGGFELLRTAAHTWSVKVDAPGSQYDRNLSGQTSACETEPTTTVAATTTIPTMTPQPPAPQAPLTTIPATTVAEDTPITVVVSPPPTAAEPPAPATHPTVLPRTGAASNTIIAAAALALVAGATATIAARRRRPSS